MQGRRPALTLQLQGGSYFDPVAWEAWGLGSSVCVHSSLISSAEAARGREGPLRTCKSRGDEALQAVFEGHRVEVHQPFDGQLAQAQMCNALLCLVAKA